MRARKAWLLPAAGLALVVGSILTGCGSLPARVAADSTQGCPYAVAAVSDGRALPGGTQVLFEQFDNGTPEWGSDSVTPRISAQDAAAAAEAATHATAVAAFHTTLRRTGQLAVGGGGRGGSYEVTGDDPVWVITLRLAGATGCPRGQSRGPAGLRRDDDGIPSD